MRTDRNITPATNRAPCRICKGRGKVLVQNGGAKEYRRCLCQRNTYATKAASTT